MKTIKIVIYSLCISGFVFGLYVWNKWNVRQKRLCSTVHIRPIDECVQQTMRKPLPQNLFVDLFSYPLLYLGKGKQSIAYETSDGQYVVKFFKQSKKKQQKLYQAIEGAYIAWAYIPEDTGIIGCSLGDQELPVSEIKLLNKKGKLEKINIKNTPFVVQKKAMPLKRTLLRLMAQNKDNEAKALLISIFSVLTTCREKGILDRDGSLMRKGNMGVISGKAVLIDTGKLYLFSAPERQTLHDVNRAKPLRKWLQQACPELVSLYKQCCIEYCNTGEKI